MANPLLQVIVASTRPGRVGGPVADWFFAAAEQEGSFDVELVDLKAVDLPLLDEPNHPRLRSYTHDHTKAWSETIDRADAFVFVMPEYNYGFNAAVKNAVDFLFHEWGHKPVSFVSYGGVSGGLRAVQMFKQVVTTVGMYPIAAAVTVPMVAKSIHDGVFQPSELVANSVGPLLAELRALTDAVKPLRS